MKICINHIQVLQTLYVSGLITCQAMKSIRGQIISMKTFEAREAYLKTIIARTAEKKKHRKEQACLPDENHH